MWPWPASPEVAPSHDDVELDGTGYKRADDVDDALEEALPCVVGYGIVDRCLLIGKVVLCET